MNAEQKKFIGDLYHALYQFLVRYANSSLKRLCRRPLPSPVKSRTMYAAAPILKVG